MVCLLLKAVSLLTSPTSFTKIQKNQHRWQAFHAPIKRYPPKCTQSLSDADKKVVPEQPAIHIYDSDVVKPDSCKFESMGRVCDGSESTVNKNVYKKGYLVTEATIPTNNKHPISIFSEIHSAQEKIFTSVNDVAFSAMERGYDDNKMFLKLHSMGQDFVICQM